MNTKKQQDKGNWGKVYFWPVLLPESYMTYNKIKALISKLWSISGPGASCSTYSSGLFTVFLQTSHTTRDHVACCAEEAAKGMTKARSLRSKGYLGRSRNELISFVVLF